MAKYLALRYDANTGTPGLTVKEGTLVKVITAGKERHLVEYAQDGETIQTWVDSEDLGPLPPTRYDRLVDSDVDIP